MFPLELCQLESVERYLAENRPEWRPRAAGAGAARDAEAGTGRAGGFDVESYVTSQGDAMAVLQLGFVLGGEHTQLFGIHRIVWCSWGSGTGEDGAAAWNALFVAARPDVNSQPEHCDGSERGHSECDL